MVAVYDNQILGAAVNDYQVLGAVNNGYQIGVLYIVVRYHKGPAVSDCQSILGAVINGCRVLGKVLYDYQIPEGVIHGF